MTFLHAMYIIIMSGNTWYEEIGGCPWYHHWYPLQLLRNIVRDQADMQAMFDNVWNGQISTGKPWIFLKGPPCTSDKCTSLYRPKVLITMVAPANNDVLSNITYKSGLGRGALPWGFWWPPHPQREPREALLRPQRPVLVCCWLFLFSPLIVLGKSQCN